MSDAEKGMQRYAFTRGCLVGNLGQEMGALPESYREQLIGVFDDWQRRTAQCLVKAQKRGEIDRRHDCDQLAAFFWIAWEGGASCVPSLNAVPRHLEQLRTTSSIWSAANYFLIFQAIGLIIRVRTHCVCHCGRIDRNGTCGGRTMMQDAITQPLKKGTTRRYYGPRFLARIGRPLLHHGAGRPRRTRHQNREIRHRR